MAARGARAATSEAADCRIHRLECFGLESMDCQFCAAIACTRLDRRPHHRDRVSLVGGTSRAQRRDRWAARVMPRRLSGLVPQREPRPCVAVQREVRLRAGSRGALMRGLGARAPACQTDGPARGSSLNVPPFARLHHAQAPTVLDHSRTLPQGDGGAGGSERSGS